MTTPLPSEMCIAIDKAAKKLNISTKTIYLTIYLKALMDFFSTEHFTILNVTNGRTAKIENANHAIGIFWNLLPISISKQISEQKQLDKVYNDLMDASAYCNFPHTELIKMNPDLEKSIATFVFTHFYNLEESFASSDFKLLNSDGYDRLAYPLNLKVSFTKASDDSKIIITYDKQYFNRDEIDNFTSCYLTFLNNFARNFY